MADVSIPGTKIALLTTNGVEQAELEQPIAALRKASGTPVIVSPQESQIQAMQGDWEHADHFDVDVHLPSANPEDYAGLVLPGGTLNADTLRTDEDAQRFVKSFFDSGKPVAAICHGPWILTEVGADERMRLRDLPLKSHERLFHERVPLPEQVPRLERAPLLKWAPLLERVPLPEWDPLLERVPLLERAPLLKWVPLLEWVRQRVEPVARRRQPRPSAVEGP